MRGRLALLCVAAASGANVPVHSGVLLSSPLNPQDTVQEDDVEDFSTRPHKPHTWTTDDVMEAAAEHPWSEVPNFHGEYPTKNDIIKLNRHVLFVLFVLSPLLVLLVLLISPVVQTYISSNFSSAPSESAENDDKAPVVVVDSEVKEVAAAAAVTKTPVPAPYYVAPSKFDKDLPEEHLSVIFERVALSQLSKVAIRAVDGSLSLTYGDLLASARRGAETLRESGLKSGELVGLMVGCSVEGCIGILSIVLAGGAYVPLDPHYPSARLSQIIEGAKLRHVVTTVDSKGPHSLAAKDSAAWLKRTYPEVVAMEIEVQRDSGNLSQRSVKPRTKISKPAPPPSPPPSPPEPSESSEDATPVSTDDASKDPEAASQSKPASAVSEPRPSTKASEPAKADDASVASKPIDNGSEPAAKPAASESQPNEVEAPAEGEEEDTSSKDEPLKPGDEGYLENLHTTSTDATLVTVLFTSGSTGKPKGVPGYEAGVLAGARFFTTEFPYGPNEAVINHITYGWVDHKMELWHALLRGKEIVVVPNTEALIKMIDSPPQNVNKLWAVPTILDAMFSAMEARGPAVNPPAFLNLVVATGEALSEHMVNRYRALMPRGTIVSSYGLTETQGETSVAIYEPSRATNGKISIGSPHSPYAYGIRSLETNEWLSGANAQGELYIAGPLILSGYYQRPDGVYLADDAANARFSEAVPEVWPRGRGPARMYQTGDLVAWREDGELQHLGRCDDQVKVNGVRIELGHVAAAAQKCKGVTDSRAAATEDPSGNLRVVVFVSGPSAPSSEDVMAELKEHLPMVYMPSACVVMTSGLPQLPNGKVDRKQLDSLAKDALDAGNGAPADSISRLIAGLGGGDMPGWHYICLHLIFVAMQTMLMAHIGFYGWYFWKKNKTVPGSHAWVNWVGVGMDISHAMIIAFFASGYMDNVAMPPKTWKECWKRLGVVLGFYILYQPFGAITGIGPVANIWPVAALLIFRTICWPIRLLTIQFGYPVWIAMAVVAGGAVLATTICRPWAGAMMCSGPAGNYLMNHFEEVMKLPAVLRSPFEDVRQLITYNSAVSLFVPYAAYPQVIAYFLPDLWKPMSGVPVEGGFMAVVLARMKEPRVYRRLIALLYLIIYQVAIIKLFAVNNGVGNLAPVHRGVVDGVSGFFFVLFYTAMQCVLCIALFVLMPARATPFSAIGSCALAAYITYLGLVENFALVVMGDGLRFIHSPFNAPAEVIQLGLIGIVTLVACSFTFGLSEPIYTLPSGLPVKLPVVHFPGGKLAFALAWFILLAIPNVLPVPAEMLSAVATHRTEGPKAPGFGGPQPVGDWTAPDHPKEAKKSDSSDLIDLKSPTTPPSAPPASPAASQSDSSLDLKSPSAPPLAPPSSPMPTQPDTSSASIDDRTDSISVDPNAAPFGGRWKKHKIPPLPVDSGDELNSVQLQVRFMGLEGLQSDIVAAL